MNLNDPKARNPEKEILSLSRKPAPWQQKQMTHFVAEKNEIYKMRQAQKHLST